MTTPHSHAGPSNRLIDATSPYLLQHAHNPVDWHEWGPEALDKARRDNKPIFLSIGYSACHWCHVMAHESFEDKATADVMNKYFVNIKIDREERPDLDELYMRATVIYTRGNGGWPMSVWLTPDMKPFAAGTYFPPETRYGRPGFKEVCEKIHEAWAERRSDIDESAEVLTRVVRQSLAPTGPPTSSITTANLDQAIMTVADAFDGQHGGITSGDTNKFPPSMILDLMLRSAYRQPAESPERNTLVTHITNTLDKMSAGGIRDHLGGGFARYSTDLQWHVPHFEKMLYDQALISSIYIDAFRFIRNTAYADIAREIFDYVLYDLRSPEGGFFSARDADSEGSEGKYYAWTRNEALIVLDCEDAELITDYYDIQPTGNWKDPHTPNVPKNILRTPIDLKIFAQQHGLGINEFRNRLDHAKEKMLAAREQRVPPGLDTKVLCEWNGLMISSLAKGGAALQEPLYIEAAKKAADFVLSTMYHDGRLSRSYRDKQTSTSAFLGDYAAMTEALLELYFTTFDTKYLGAANEMNNTAIDLFWDDDHGGFFFTACDHETLLARPKEINDGAIPSGNAIQLSNLLKLATIRGDQSLREKAERLIDVFGSVLLDAPVAGSQFLCGIDFARSELCETIIVGPLKDERTQKLIRAAHDTYNPNMITLARDPGNEADAETSPLFQQRDIIAGNPTAYVCRGATCLPPITDEKILREQLECT